MKKSLIAALLLMATGAYALEPAIVNKSSAITAANSTGAIQGRYLDKVVIGMATSGGVLELYSSTWTASVLISSVSLTAVGTFDFDDTQVKGLYCKTSSNTNGVTIIYK
jgi:hypothetical protein